MAARNIFTPIRTKTATAMVDISHSIKSNSTVPPRNTLGVMVRFEIIWFVPELFRIPDTCQVLLEDRSHTCDTCPERHCVVSLDPSCNRSEKAATGAHRSQKQISLRAVKCGCELGPVQEHRCSKYRTAALRNSMSGTPIIPGRKTSRYGVSLSHFTTCCVRAHKMNSKAGFEFSPPPISETSVDLRVRILI